MDPYEIKAGKAADYIFITHNHYDHMSIVDIKKEAVKKTLVICPKECEKELKDFNLKVVVPGDKFDLEGLKVEAVPAYNNVKPFHTKSSLKVGYVLTIGKARIYHAGDTDFITEMKDLKNITVAMVPIGGMFTMDPKEAAQAINAIKPAIAVPMHYGYKIGKKENAAEFEGLVDKSIKVDVMEQEE
jgi:L-ascorbate metabolism protein UlaG (beta-lactamase superfamily)